MHALSASAAWCCFRLLCLLSSLTLEVHDKVRRLQGDKQYWSYLYSFTNLNRSKRTSRFSAEDVFLM